MTEAEFLATDDVAALLAQFVPPAGRSSRTGAKLNSFPVSSRRLRLWACAVCRQAWDGAVCPECLGVMPTASECPNPECDGGRVGGLTDPRSRRAVETVERHADGLATDGELADACRFAGEVAGPSDDASWWAYVWAAGGHVGQASGRIECVPAAVQAALSRCVFGNPFRPVAVSASWLTPDVRALARAAYDERGGEACGECDGTGHKHEKNWHGAWDEWLCAVCGGTGRVATTGHLDPVRLVLLADALEEAGATDAALLQHLRGRERCPRCQGHTWYHSGPGGGQRSLQHCGDCDVAGTVPLRGPHVRGCFAVDAVLGLS